MTPENFGRYEIISELGRGGMATVFHAYDPRFQRDVAIKVLPREFLHDPNFRARFEQEAQTIAGLEHPAILPVYDFGEQEGQPFLVMRFLAGGSLEERLSEHGALPVDEASRIIEHLAPAIDEAHQRGVIHRDLKPANILFDHRNMPYIADFGIAKLTTGGKSLTSGAYIIGTPDYMSPEQASGEKIDGQVDIYALGVIIFETLTGRLPYNAETPVGLLMKHISEPVPNILQVKADLPPGCKNVISTAMAKDPTRRYRTAVALAQAFRQSTQGDIPAVAPMPASSPTPPLDLPLPPPPTGPVRQLACPACGAPLPAAPQPNQQVECASCGSKFVVTLPQPADPTIVCAHCQTVNSNELRYCANCGQSLKIDCVRCHTQNPVDATHCYNCGANLKRARASAAKLLGQICDEQDIRGLVKARVARALIKTLADADPLVRYWAAEALGKFKGQPAQLAVEPLGALLRDKNEEVRQQARESLQKIGGKRASELLDNSKGFIGWLKGN